LIFDINLHEAVPLKCSFFAYFLIFVLCVSSIFFLSRCGKEEKEPTSPLAPDFTLRTLDGQEITLFKLKGKVILLDFWATWCGPCRESIPHLIQLYNTYQKNGLEVIGMNMDRENISTVRHFVKSMDIPYPIAITPYQVERSYGVTGLPTTILIDKDGRIREKIAGYTSEIAKQMTAKALELISEKPEK
jgi:cytochrome c biogenesis protein CcmG/thiol:disulfide interchange protein DsbE